MPSKTSDLTNDSGFITSADVADKRDYDDLTYANRSQEAMTRAPTYGIGKMIATPSDGQTDPVVMDTFFIHENPSDPSDSLGSTWYAPSFVFAGTTDGTNFRMVTISFQTLATFTKTQLLAGEVTFTFQDKTWTLTAELGDGMIDWWNININSMDWKTTTYSYDPSTRIAKWRPSTIDSWFITREYPTSSIKLDGNWTAKVWRGTSEEHGDKMVEQINVGPAYGYGGGVEKTFIYGDNTSFLKVHLMGYPFQSNLGLAERIPQQVGMLKNDIGYITMSGAERTFASKSEVSALDASVIALGSDISSVGASVSAMASTIDLTNSHVSALESRMGEVSASVSALGSSVSDLGSQVSALASSVSAMASSLSAKRDYLDLTYSYSSTTTLSYYDLYYGEPWHMNYNDGVEDTTQQWGIQEIHVSIPSQLARDYEEWLEGMGLSLPDGYSSFPTEWTLTYVDATEIGTHIDFNDTGLDPVENPKCAWLPMGEITVGGQTTNWTQYLVDITGEPLLGMYLFKNPSQNYAWYNLVAAVESLDARFTTTQFSMKDVGSQVLTGTGEETDHGTYFNIPTTPFQMSFTWHDTNENEHTDTVYVTPVMNSSSVVVNDNLALQGSVNALTSSVEANASAISANTSAISAMASNFTVSGIGCSTILFSGTYSDSTSFAYNIVVQPSASV